MTKDELVERLASGPYVWPGGYTLSLLTREGDCLCFDCAQKADPDDIVDGLGEGESRLRSAWFVNWEDKDLICDDCNKRIDPEYGD